MKQRLQKTYTTWLDEQLAAPDNPHWLGGTMGPPGPASPLDPNQFLRQPSYLDVVEDTRPSRTDFSQLRGPGPHRWIADELGRDTVTVPKAGNWPKHSSHDVWPAIRAVYTHHDHRVVAQAKGRPLGSENSIRRAERAGEFAQLSRKHLIHSSPVLRFAPHEQTSLRAGSMAQITVFQAHWRDPVCEVLKKNLTRFCSTSKYKK